MDRSINFNPKTYFIVFILALVSCEESKTASKQFNNNKGSRCLYSLKKLWQAEVSSFPFAAPPLVVDTDGDNGLDLVAAPFGESLAVIEGETGKSLHDTMWPQHNLERYVHSTPLQFDIDGDGILDLLFMTSEGECLFYSSSGTRLPEFNFQIKPAYVKLDWYKEQYDREYDPVGSYVSENPNNKDSIPLDPHVLASPILHNMRKLVIPVSYYFSLDDYSSISDLPYRESEARTKYFVTGLVMIDLLEYRGERSAHLQGGGRSMSSKYIKTRFMELKQSPAYLLYSPTISDLDGSFANFLVAIGSTSGLISVISVEKGTPRPGFPLHLESISTRVAVGELNNAPGLELVFATFDGNVTCVSSNTGKVLWTTPVKGESFAGPRLADINLDGSLDVIIGTDAGFLYGLNGKNGSIIPRYPFQVGHKISGNILVTKFNIVRPYLDLVFLSDDGYLNILASDHSCYSQIPLEETSLVDLMHYNLILRSKGLEVVVSTTDGTLICFGSGQEAPIEEYVDIDYQITSRRLSWPFDQNNLSFMFKERPLVFIDERTRIQEEVTGSSFPLYFTVQDVLPTSSFNIKVYLGSDVVYQIDNVKSSSIPEMIAIPTPKQPGKGQITFCLFDLYGFVSKDSFTIKFNQLILQDLRWLVLTPFIGMSIILLVNHGFPAKDFLPVVSTVKSK